MILQHRDLFCIWFVCKFSDILLTLSSFTDFALSYVVHMPKTHQALVEYEGMVGSSAAVNAAISQFYVADHRTYIDYSTKQKLSRGGDSENHRNITKVLLLTFTNSITTVNVSTDLSTFTFSSKFAVCEIAVGNSSI